MTTYFKNASNPHIPVRDEWLDLRDEVALNPSLPILDAHHHLWSRQGSHYLLEDFEDDLARGHNVKATVFIECNTMYRDDGPEELKELGETEYAASIAQASHSKANSPARVCAGIVGCADLSLGAGVQEILEAHIEAGRGHFRGVRMTSAYFADGEVRATTSNAPEHLLMSSNFRTGFSRLAPLGLSFDAWLYHPQLGELYDLAKSFPDTRIVLNHVGAPLGVGPFRGRRSEVYGVWKHAIRQLAQLPNVAIKLSGLGLRIAGFDFHEKPLPPTSEQLAEGWKPYIETCIDYFEPQRCMFASNFPVDKGTCSYSVVWNAFKRIAENYSESELAWLFHQTAADTYRINTT